MKCFCCLLFFQHLRKYHQGYDDYYMEETPKRQTIYLLFPCECVKSSVTVCQDISSVVCIVPNICHTI